MCVSGYWPVLNARKESRLDLAVNPALGGLQLAGGWTNRPTIQHHLLQYYDTVLKKNRVSIRLRAPYDEINETVQNPNGRALDHRNVWFNYHRLDVVHLFRSSRLERDSRISCQSRYGAIHKLLRVMRGMGEEGGRQWPKMPTWVDGLA